jgi:transcriptional regulator GlxA family with amidase domain
MMSARTTAEKRFDAPESVIVPAIACKILDALNAALARPYLRDAAKALREWASEVKCCRSGIFVLAESGLLNQQGATTTWWLAPVC